MLLSALPAYLRECPECEGLPHLALALKDAYSGNPCRRQRHHKPHPVAL